ncbi:5-hydroxytryptamine receptor-like [Pollicipes pollicipes]|uniref:5-hydroxytryptamine receptor-like n=1 Tax=Pollicipes pollicipes TaxID=41117 RepID=UPI0018851692|nr:5-hydroxytryptamine receptor-like [Pollicipes pollicipes]
MEAAEISCWWQLTTSCPSISGSWWQLTTRLSVSLRQLVAADHQLSVSLRQLVAADHQLSVNLRPSMSVNPRQRVVTAEGNVFVIAAIVMEKGLQNVANYLIVSLAVADLMVACLVMPLGAMYEITGSWALGPELCDMWTSADVLCCTASILHLLAIAIDRYWAVTNINYIQSRNSRRVLTMIVLVWVFALAISVGPVFGWKDPDFEDRVNVNQECLVSQDVGYQVFATMASFYVPLGAILSLYWRIFQAARRRIRHKVGSNGKRSRYQRPPPPPPPPATDTATLTGSRVSEYELSSCATPTNNGNGGGGGVSSVDVIPRDAEHRKKKTKKETLEAKRERKAAKTLAIVTGAFIMCWLPFFVTAPLLPLCNDCFFNGAMMSFFLWLGWFNSTLNPIIYTIFSPDFRQAFKKILCGRAAVKGRRGR